MVESEFEVMDSSCYVSVTVFAAATGAMMWGIIYLFLTQGPLLISISQMPTWVLLRSISTPLRITLDHQQMAATKQHVRRTVSMFTECGGGAGVWHHRICGSRMTLSHPRRVLPGPRWICVMAAGNPKALNLGPTWWRSIVHHVKWTFHYQTTVRVFNEWIRST